MRKIFTRLTFFSIILIGFSACMEGNKPVLIGSYKSRSFNLIQTAYLKYVKGSLFTIGDILNLEADSSYRGDTLNLWCAYS